MAAWIINAVLLVAIVLAARYCWKKFHRGECIGCPGGGCSCSEGGCCHCHEAQPKTK
ncbi:MAG: FeoB-associated Cys-rich membrane protein [Phascolarctobacterium sp.]|nr:MAG: FeoB-associated Cys-rich membrane protein [Phascolarctobacterium sp.]